MQAVPATSDLPLLVEGAIALGLGLCIGLEREHRHVDEAKPRPTINGVRTFALLALSGWLAAVLEDRWTWMPGRAAGARRAAVVAQYLRESRDSQRFGVTTELAALLTVVYTACSCTTTCSSRSRWRW